MHYKNIQMSKTCNNNEVLIVPKDQNTKFILFLSGCKLFMATTP